MFSVAPVSLNGRVLGYLYVVVGGELYQTWVMRLHDSHILGSAAVVAGTVVLAGALAGLIGFWYLTSFDPARQRLTGVRTRRFR